MGTFILEREVEFDAGHRVPDHASKCRSPHGHRYKVVAHVGSRTLQSSGSATGMVVDFGDVSELLKEKIHDVLDHGWILYEGDAEMRRAFGVEELPDPEYIKTMKHVVFNVQGWKIIPFPYTPTAENIAKWAFEELVYEIDNMSKPEHIVWLQAVAVYETPKSVVTFTREEIKP